MNHANKKICYLLSFNLLAFSLSGCLKTRSEVSADEQSQMYTKKHAMNQSAEHESQLNQKVAAAQSAVDERDELIRTLNGRVENLEGQINQMSKEKTTQQGQESEKVQLLQEALVKMQAQLQKLESEQAQKQAALETAQQAAAEAQAKEAQVTKNEKHDKVEDKKTNHNKSNTKVSSEKNSNSYEVAQGHFASKEWKKAILNYQKYSDEFPKGKEVADAKYKIGVCFQELDMKEEAMAFYEEVIANYSKSEAGKKAKLRLNQIKK